MTNVFRNLRGNKGVVGAVVAVVLGVGTVAVLKVAGKQVAKKREVPNTEEPIENVEYEVHDQSTEE